MVEEQRCPVLEDEVCWQSARDYAGKVGLSGKNRPGSPRVLWYKLRIVRICPQCMARCTAWRKLRRSAECGAPPGKTWSSTVWFCKAASVVRRNAATNLVYNSSSALKFCSKSNG